MRNLKLTLSYEGTDFAGWQRQPDRRTVQSVVESALEPIEGAPVTIIGAGRTDAGVHAAGQVASVSLSTPIPLDELQRALNGTLPPDVRVIAIETAPIGFDARRLARHKTYRYLIWSDATMPPLLRRVAWHVTYRLDLAAMRAASATLVGRRDFVAFRSAGADDGGSVREVLSATWTLPDRAGAFVEDCAAVGDGILLRFEITGTGFLRHMVRAIVGTLVDVGRARLIPEDVARILASQDRSAAGPTAPAHGLTLWRVDYTDSRYSGTEGIIHRFTGFTG
jgi:tRNA pseudouridine38-40 synthase